MAAVLLSLLGLALVAVLAAFLSITAYLHYQHRRFAHLPRPEPFHFYLGHFPSIRDTAKSGSHFYTLFIDWYYQCGPVYVFYILHQPRIVCLDPKDVKEVSMDTKICKPGEVYDNIGYVMGERFLGKGLVNEPYYEVWKPRRSLYDPAFSKVYLKTLIPAFNECVDRMMEKLTPLADGVTVVPMKKELATVTLDIISKVAFGSDYRSFHSDIPEIKQEGSELQGLLNHALEGVRMPFYYFLYTYRFPFKTRSYRKAVQAIRKIGRECIQRRISAIENGEQVPNDILTQIIKVTRTSDDITMEALVDDFVTFYVAGQETTANLLSFALPMILQHPAVLSRLVDEVADVLGDREVVTSEDVEKLQYTLQVLEETLRLCPPVPGYNRKTTREMKLGGYRIPKDTILSLNPYAACRLTENFEDPEMFDPNRFSPDRPRPDPFVYAPFARGHRSCIGQVFALIEARIILARLLQKFRFSLPADFKLEMEQKTTMQPKGLVPCTLRLVQED